MVGLLDDDRSGEVVEHIGDVDVVEDEVCERRT